MGSSDAGRTPGGGRLRVVALAAAVVVVDVLLVVGLVTLVVLDDGWTKVLWAAVGALLLWQLVKLEFSSYRFGERAPTYLETPLWIPRLAMAIGVAALVFSIVRTFLAHVRRFRRLGPAHVRP